MIQMNWSLLIRSVRLSTALAKSTTTWLLRDRSSEPKTLPSWELSSSLPGLSTHLKIHSKSTKTPRFAGHKKKTKTTVFGHSQNRASATSSRLSSISNGRLATQVVRQMPLPQRATVASTKSSSQACSQMHLSDRSEHGKHHLVAQEKKKENLKAFQNISYTICSTLFKTHKTKHNLALNFQLSFSFVCSSVWLTALLHFIPFRLIIPSNPSVYIPSCSFKIQIYIKTTFPSILPSLF